MEDGNLISAAEEERFTRVKHVAGFPTEAVRACLKIAGVSPSDIGSVAVSRDPWAHGWNKVMSLIRRGLAGGAARDRLASASKIWNIKERLQETLGKEIQPRVHFIEHHRAHISSSFYPSGWDHAAILSLDGFGDSVSGMWGIGKGSRLRIDGSVRFPHSLGVLYTAVTQFLGFPNWGDEYKLMGLAAYGDPAPFRQVMRSLCSGTPGGEYRLNLDYFRHHQGDFAMTWASGSPSMSFLLNRNVEKLLGLPRAPGSPLEQRHKDIAAALQERVEELILELLRQLSARTRLPRLCYAGGVALNSVLNGKIRRETPFKEIFIQPAAHDAGTSLGAALYVAHQLQKTPRRFVMKHAAWGPGVDEGECRAALEKAGVSFKVLKGPEELISTAADALAQGKILGWFQGRMEFGPRSLGYRSLLADPRDPAMKDRINQKVKRRETFRPFAPSVKEESIAACFPTGHPDPFMLFAYPADAELGKKFPAAVHVDGTGRLQAVSKEAHPLFWSLIRAFEERTGVPVLLNTSFNEQEPIVCRPEEALACFQRTGIDCLALGPFWVEKL